MADVSPWMTYGALAVSACSLFVSICGPIISYRWSRASDRNHIRTEWNNILDKCIASPTLLDTKYSKGYKERDASDRLSYEAFCHKVWSLIEFIIENDLDKYNRYRAYIRWAITYHRDWLNDNPYIFSSQKFWKKVEIARNEPITMFRNPTLPNKIEKPFTSNKDRYSDDVNWNLVHDKYHEYIIGPWSSHMTSNDGSAPRNHIITALRSYSEDELKEMIILDFGCGPGNLLDFLPPGSNVFGLDISEEALKIASSKATKKGIIFRPLNLDMRDFKSEQKFDIVIASNSILPVDRVDVLPMMKAIRACLKPNGKLIAILPSYDTCEALLEYWEELYRLTAINEGRSLEDAHIHAMRCRLAFETTKKFDPKDLRFADDGLHLQCFHTPESIKKEFGLAGLSIIGGPNKVLYPWIYARDFDYGFFPEKPEIWDWFVEATPQRVPNVL